MISEIALGGNGRVYSGLLSKVDPSLPLYAGLSFFNVMWKILSYFLFFAFDSVVEGIGSGGWIDHFIDILFDLCEYMKAVCSFDLQFFQTSHLVHPWFLPFCQTIDHPARSGSPWPLIDTLRLACACFFGLTEYY